MERQNREPLKPKASATRKNQANYFSFTYWSSIIQAWVTFKINTAEGWATRDFGEFKKVGHSPFVSGKTRKDQPLALSVSRCAIKWDINVVTTPTPAVQPPSGKTIANKWWGKIRLYVAVIGVGLQVYAVYALKMSLDLLTGVALITLLFMMLQTEHERCDRVRAGWREVRRTTFTTTSAVQWAKKKQGLAGGWRSL